MIFSSKNKIMIPEVPDLFVTGMLPEKQELAEFYRNMDFPYYDREDVLHALRISPRTLQTYRDEGILPYTRIRNKFYYKKSDIEELLEKNYTGPKKPKA